MYTILQFDPLPVVIFFHIARIIVHHLRAHKSTITMDMPIMPAWTRGRIIMIDTLSNL